MEIKIGDDVLVRGTVEEIITKKEATYFKVTFLGGLGFQDTAAVLFTSIHENITKTLNDMAKEHTRGVGNSPVEG